MILRQPDATPGAILKIIGKEWRDLDASAKRGYGDRAVPRLAGRFERPKAKITHEERMAAVRSRAQVVKGVLSDTDIADLGDMSRLLTFSAKRAVCQAIHQGLI